MERIPAAAIALLLALGPLVGVLHAHEGGHRYCPDHAAFEEATGARPTWHCGAAGCRVFHLVPVDDGDDRHEGCACADLLRRDVCSADRVSWFAVAAAHHREPIALRSALVRRNAVYRAAPKNSPPLSLA